jgi:hypothetical protein
VNTLIGIAAGITLAVSLTLMCRAAGRLHHAVQELHAIGQVDTREVWLAADQDCIDAAFLVIADTYDTPMHEGPQA